MEQVQSGRWVIESGGKYNLGIEAGRVAKLELPEPKAA